MNPTDFIIENGVLTEYTGPGGDVIIPDGVTEIGYSAFLGRTNLTSVVIPDSVTVINNYAFYGCRSLTRVNIPNSVTQIDDGIFIDCSSLTSVTLPNSITAIGRDMFHGCKSLTNITLPEGVIQIGTDAFKQCTSLTHIVSPTVPFAQYDTPATRRAAIFGFMEHLALYTDPAVAESYRKYLFSQRNRLLPEILKQDLVGGIAAYAEGKKITVKNFESDFFTPAQEANATQCVAYLLDWKNKYISAADEETHLEHELAKDPFNAADMKKLWKYEVHGDTVTIKWYIGSDLIVSVPPRIGKRSVTAIGDWAFSACENLRSVTIPDSVTQISDRAFYDCWKVTLRASASSFAEKYAKKENIPFEAL